MVSGTFDKGGRVIKRAILCGAVALAAAALLAPGAGADRPIKEPVGDLNATGPFCEGFDVEIVTTANKEVNHIFSSGVSLVTGVLKVEVTNLSTEKTLALNISGPGKLSADGNTLTGGGPWLIFGEAGVLPGGDPGMFFTHGQITLTLSPTQITSMTVRGTVVDICAALASS
jgi:hypothetical protein